MKNLTLTLILSMLIACFSYAQESTLKNLTAFDKLVVKGKAEKIVLHRGSEDHPAVRIEGAANADILSEVNAGTLTLTIQRNTPVKLHVYNSHLKRVEASGNVEITGAEVIGDEGNYLVVSFDRSHEGVMLADMDEHFNVRIPAIDIDIPEIDVAIDIPEFDFDFDFDFDHNFDVGFEMNKDFNYHWEGHKEELKRWSDEWKEETKEAIKEAQIEIKRAKEEMRKVNKD
ncbi:hypothetical protein [Fulvivirga kasyanovii]|uniref:Auto-transporter adhesin head GIN domain-containing protein n=1 Tax=Fulvivirga kasyanovii TaxID=396812 RepID=A0ABW9RT15_9BACT|nr:hypothetical protein [Fulvivirga kasyanovii]MTI27324.1 hypothetical protein [Fulvivirga kasyanovii]